MNMVSAEYDNNISLVSENTNKVSNNVHRQIRVLRLHWTMQYLVVHPFGSHDRSLKPKQLPNRLIGRVAQGANSKLSNMDK